MFLAKAAAELYMKRGRYRLLQQLLQKRAASWAPHHDSARELAKLQLVRAWVMPMVIFSCCLSDYWAFFLPACTKYRGEGVRYHLCAF